MAAKDKKSVIRSLIENGKANGKLTTSEINDALEQLDFDVEKVDKLYDTLESLNILFGNFFRIHPAYFSI